MADGPLHKRDESRRATVAGFDPSFEPLVALIRGESVESVHRGAIAVVDRAGMLVGAVGDPGTEVVLRSTAKPFQAAAVVASGAADTLLLTEEEIAVMAGSHTGTPQHVEVVARLLRRAAADPAVLACGSIGHMCSGKHAGMILLAAHRGVPATGYEQEEHPVQQEIKAYLASLLRNAPRAARCATVSRRAARSEVAPSGAAVRPGSRTLFRGIDGCGVPAIGITLSEAAWLFAQLAAGATPALARVRDAMLAHPLLVAGEGKLDTTLMRTGAGAIVAKGGAEGMQGLGLPVGPGGRGAVGFVLKVEDGSGRPIPTVVTAFLRLWGLGRVTAEVERLHMPVIRDPTGREAARIEALTERGALYHAACTGDRPEQPPAATTAEGGFRRFLGRKGDDVTISRGDEKDIQRFLRDQWPGVDREYFGRTVEWTAEPLALVHRQGGKITGVLRGHFIGGLASVDELIVGEGSRGCGLGSLLLGRFEEEAFARRCTRIVLRAVKGTLAEDFYRKRGYHRECVQYGYEFGYDYVRLTCDARHRPRQSEATVGGSEGEG